MATAWLYRTVKYTEVNDPNGWTFWKPDSNALTKTLNEIMEYADQKGYRVTSMIHLPHEAGYDYQMVGIHPTTIHEREMGKSHKVHIWGVTIVVFLEK